MKKIFLLSLSFLFVFNLHAQYGVSGYINSDSVAQVSLLKINIEAETGELQGEKIAVSEVNEDGWFAFSPDLFTEAESIYKLEVVGMNARGERIFIHSQTDSLYFAKDSMLLGESHGTNPANLELKNMQNSGLASANLPRASAYVKDSLHILLVKLMGIRQLADKNFLEKDIRTNPDYYITLVDELRSSDLDAREYMYLESRVAVYTAETFRAKYIWSLVFNGLSFVALSVVVFFLLKYKRDENKKHVPPSLSKQEEAIRALILTGKSNKEIAAELYVSVNTVKTHITNLYSKLGVSNRKQVY